MGMGSLLLLGLLGLGLLVAVVAAGLRVVQEYKRLVVFRLGKFHAVKGPGLVWICPGLDRIVEVDIRTLTVDVPKQNIVTKDNVSIGVDAVVYYRVTDPMKAVVAVEDFIEATNLLAQSALRDVIGESTLDEVLTQREMLNRRLTEIVDRATDPWGVKVSDVKIKDVTLPEELVRAMAAQAEAERRKRARILLAEGELEASRKMAEAAETYDRRPTALRLRELQTLVDVAREGSLVVLSSTEALAALPLVAARRAEAPPERNPKTDKEDQGGS